MGILGAWGRFMNSAQAARRAWMSYGSTTDALSLDPLKWDLPAVRMGRYAIFEAFYNNTAYLNPNVLLQIQANRPKLYKSVRGIYNPTNRFVSLTQSNIYGGALDMQGRIAGAIPIEQADKTLLDAIIQTWKWSNWQTNKSIYVQTGAKFGDVLLKVVDDTFKQRVRMEVLDPRKVVDLVTDEVGDITYVYIEYERLDDNGKAYTYGEEITPETFKTFKDNQPHPYYTDASGKEMAEWDNEYGFVPMALCQYSPTGHTWGQNGYYAALDKISEVNDQASLLNDQVRKVINPVWAVTGASKGGQEVDFDIDRENIPLMYIPKESSIQAVITPIDIASASSNIKDLLAELERDLPELALYRLREQASVTAPGVKAAYSDAIGRIQEARGQYDGTLVKAQQMAIAIGGYRRYEGFTAYSLDSYENGDLEHFVGNRAVVPDELSLLDKVNVLNGLGGTKKLVLQALGYPDDVIEEIVGADEARARAEVQSMTQGIFGNEPDDDDGDIVDEDETVNEDEDTA